jgi:hypothetical protein
MAPTELQPSSRPGPQRKENTVDIMKSSVFRPVDREDTHPHACTEGLVYLAYTAYDEEVAGEVERIEVVPCRRCQASLSSEDSKEGLSPSSEAPPSMEETL